MPIYEYVCGKCARKTEVIQRMGDPKLKVCPHCGGKLTKAFSAPAIQFKGSGWYVTDYARAKSEGGSSSRSDEGSRESGSKESGSKDSGEKAGKSSSVEAKSEKSEKADKSSRKKKDS